MKEDDGILVLWNENEFAELLKQHLGAEAIVTSEAELLANEFQNVSAIVVLAELNWGGKKLSDLNGIIIASTILRARLKLRAPILFVSFLPYRQVRADLSGREILERRIVGVVGHDYLQLPSAPEQWLQQLQEMRPLTDLQFADVFNSFCGVKGLIEDVIHQLRNRCHSLFNSRPKRNRELAGLSEKAFDEISALLGQTAGAQNVRASVTKFDFASAGKKATLDFLDKSQRDFQALITEDDVRERNKVPDSSPPFAWQALILDDEPDALAYVFRALESRGVKPIVVERVSEAERLIEEDRNNLITVAISDYRLLETIDGVTRQQPRQGYDFLFDLAARDRFTRLIALSGLSRRFLLESFRKSQTRVEVYSKNDLSGHGAINLFADNVLDLGAEAYEALCSQPTATEWNLLKPFYIAHRQAADYSLEEVRICALARRVALQIETLLHNRDEEAFFNPQLPRFENLQKRMKVNGPEEIKALMPVFRNKLAARRLAIWLHLAAGFDAVKILLALNGEMVPDRLLNEIKEDLRKKADEKGSDWAESIHINARNELKNRAKQPLRALALSLSDLPDGILVEEKAWLRYDMGLDVGGQQAATAPYWIQAAAEEWCERYAERAARLAGQLEFMNQDGKPTISSWQDGKRFLLAASEVLETEAEVADFLTLLEKVGRELIYEGHVGKVAEIKELSVSFKALRRIS